MISVKQKLESYQKTFVELGAKDNAAFEKVMEAFKLPKETDAEKEIRSKKIEEATLGAADIPAQVMKTCADILPLLKIVIDKGNRNSLSDAGVAASLIGTAAKSAYMNVIINCSSLSNQTIAQEIKKRADVSIEEISRSSDFLVEQVVKAIQPA